MIRLPFVRRSALDRMAVDLAEALFRIENFEIERRHYLDLIANLRYRLRILRAARSCLADEPSVSDP